MKRDLQRIYLLLVIVSVIMIGALAALFWGVQLEADRTKLSAILATASAWELDAATDLQALSDLIADSSPPLRVTFMRRDGVVLCDSESDAALMDNHADRPEVLEALEQNIGESVRQSSTLSIPTLYAATKVSDSLVLRLSYPLEVVTQVLAQYFLFALALLIAGFFILRHSIAQFARRLIWQFDCVRQLLENRGAREDDIDRRVCDEFRPLLRDISLKINKLYYDLSEVRREQNLRRALTADISHKLKNPLTSIIGFAEMLADGKKRTDFELSQYAGCIVREGNHLKKTVEEMLLQAQSETVPPSERTEIDLKTMSREIVMSLEPVRRDKQITVSIHGNGRYKARRSDMHEILYNLIINAILYGRQHGKVEIALENGMITVVDDGIGIAQEDLSHLFERFYRAKEAIARNPYGSGLGLNIVMNCVHRYGGDVFVTSEPAKGSRFAVVLPLDDEDQWGLCEE